jgi:hypothetical protein
MLGRAPWWCVWGGGGGRGGGAGEGGGAPSPQHASTASAAGGGGKGGASHLAQTSYQPAEASAPMGCRPKHSLACLARAAPQAGLAVGGGRRGCAPAPRPRPPPPPCSSSSRAVRWPQCDAAAGALSVLLALLRRPAVTAPASATALLWVSLIPEALSVERSLLASCARARLFAFGVKRRRPSSPLQRASVGSRTASPLLIAGCRPALQRSPLWAQP